MAEKTDGQVPTSARGRPLLIPKPSEARRLAGLLMDLRDSIDGLDKKIESMNERQKKTKETLAQIQANGAAQAASPTRVDLFRD